MIEILKAEYLSNCGKLAAKGYGYGPKANKKRRIWIKSGFFYTGIYGHFRHKIGTLADLVNVLSEQREILSNQNPAQ